MTDAQFQFTVVTPLMFLAAAAFVYVATGWMDWRSRREEAAKSRRG